LVKGKRGGKNQTSTMPSPGTWAVRGLGVKIGLGFERKKKGKKGYRNLFKLGNAMGRKKG